MRKKDEKAGLLVLLLFLIYLAILTWIILFKMQFSLRYMPYIRSINLIPFGRSMIVNNTLDMQELIYNIIVFIPFGLYLGMLMPGKSFWKQVLLVACASIVLEALQYVLAIGATDITDVINNTLGGLIGSGLYLILYTFLGRKTNKILKWIALVLSIIIIVFILSLILMNL